MALVGYSSSSDADDDDDDDEPPPATRAADQSGSGSGSAMPPLPAAFHDLYASSVRQSVVDDASLHRGRTRQTPHVPGIWPTHVYVEWHPTETQHATLTNLVDVVAAELGPGVALHSLLVSDLGSPLPLHISLSRPLGLPTADRDGFLDKLAQSVRGAGAFVVRPRDLAWWTSPAAGRAFLVLRVASAAAAAASPNPELSALVARCNAVARLFGQPPLYQGPGGGVDAAAFHVSVAWALRLPDEPTAGRGLLAHSRFRGVPSWDLDVAAVKAKIGNVVNHVALHGRACIG